MSTKKTFETVAESISHLMDPTIRLNAAIAVAAAFTKLNPRFDSDKFFVACGVSN